MPDPSAAPSSIPAWLRGANLVDVLVILFLLLYALDGVRRGFLAGALGLLGIIGTILLGLKAYPVAAQLIRSLTPAPPLAANILGFFVVVLLGQLIFAVCSRLILLAVRPAFRLLPPLRALDRVAGALPGLVQGLAVAAIVLTLAQLLPLPRPVSEAIAGSVAGQQMAGRTAMVTPQLESLLGQVVKDGGLLRSRVIGPEEQIQIAPQTNLQPDPEAEVRMLDLLNQERVREGLRPLQADERLRQVARSHSEEMFRLGYFSHTSPRTGSPSDRLLRHGLLFRISGENLAYAPTVELAHSGLMASPGHRRNILTPEFTRVGIGAISAGLHGRMFTQNFAG